MAKKCTLFRWTGVLKICDFGLARVDHGVGAYTPNVVTLWYRSPEILLGSKHYGSKADMWATGCILAELILNSPLFPAKTEIELLTLLVQTLGTHIRKVDRWLPVVKELQGWHESR